MRHVISAIGVGIALGVALVQGPGRGLDAEAFGAGCTYDEPETLACNIFPDCTTGDLVSGVNGGTTHQEDGDAGVSGCGGSSSCQELHDAEWTTDGCGG